MAHPIGHLNSLYNLQVLEFVKTEMQQKYSFYSRAEDEKPLSPASILMMVVFGG